MEGFGGFGFSDPSCAMRKKRSITSHRPRNDSQLPSDYHDISSLSSTPPSDNISKVSSEENNNNSSTFRMKDMNLNLNVIKDEDGGLGESDEDSFNGSFRGSYEQRNHGFDSKRSSKGVLAPANWKSTGKAEFLGTMQDELDNENRVKKVKLKVGGVTRTIHAKSIADDASTKKSIQISDIPQPRKKLNLQGNLENNDDGRILPGFPSKAFPRSNLHVQKADSPSESIRKSKRVPKKRSLDEALDDEDDEIRYLEKLKTSKVNVHYEAEYGDSDTRNRKQLKISRLLKKNVDIENYGSTSKLNKEGKKSRSQRVYNDTDYVEEEEPVSDGEPENIKRKKLRKEFVDSQEDFKKEMTVTTRQRALQTGKDVCSSYNAGLIKFPNGLPPAPSRKQKEKLSEVELQLKKAEAAQRRRMQVEKTNRESEAEAIRKILGQDSSRKKREEKIKKRQEDLAQEKAANATLASNSVRWIIGPLGTVVTFPPEMGLPAIFHSQTCSYPPPREKCAGPSCTNLYKYRDAKSKLPLCSLQCYKAIQETMQPPLGAC